MNATIEPAPSLEDLAKRHGVTVEVLVSAAELLVKAAYDAGWADALAEMNTPEVTS